MEPKFVAFRKYADINDARQLEALFIDKEIPCLLKDTSPALGTAFAGTMQNEYEIQVLTEDFDKATAVMQDDVLKTLDDIPQNYYLLDFADAELIDVLSHHDEWSEFDYLLARKLLKERGKEITEEQLRKLQTDRLAQLLKPEPSQKTWIIIGYVLALLGGLFGIITGYVLWTSKKTLPNGQQAYMYSEHDRKQGRTLMILGFIILPLSILARLLLSGQL